MLNQRDLLRGAGLGALVVGAPELLAACGGGSAGSSPTPARGGMRLVAADVPRSAADPTAASAGVDSVLALGSGLYQQLAGQGGNLALSPYSVAVALAMTLNGAVGHTQTEMLSALRADSASSIDDGLNALTQHVESLAGPVRGGNGEVVDLAATNQLFGQHGEHWKQPFLDALARNFGAGLREVDYVGHTEDARDDINTWTSRQTHGRIPEIIPGGVLDTMTRLVLVNTLYFKAPWLTPFEKAATKDADFHLAGGSAVAVPTMHGKTAGYGSGDGWRSGRLPYAGDLAMTVVLPDQGRQADLDALVSTGHLADLLATQPGEVDVAVPRWTFRTASSLQPALSALGMPTAFTSAADFSGMTEDDKLSLSAVLHQVFIAVDEAGTEAAAATAVAARLSAMPVAPPVPPLVLDRPFLFVIHDLKYDTPLFLGRVSDPRG